MADINVERRGPSVWPWVIGLIVLALLVWALVEMFGRGETVVVPAADTLQVQTPGAETMPTLLPETPADTSMVGAP